MLQTSDALPPTRCSPSHCSIEQSHLYAICIFQHSHTQFINSNSHLAAALNPIPMLSINPTIDMLHALTIHFFHLIIIIRVNIETDSSRIYLPNRDRIKSKLRVVEQASNQYQHLKIPRLQTQHNRGRGR